ncbi:MAG: Hsp20/alpha crystallin family protein [Anaeromyxobacteraceae bacterium]
MAKLMKQEEAERREHALHWPTSLVPRWMDDLLLDRWIPFAPMFRLADEMGMRVPAVDVFAEGGDVVVKAELPGLRREEITVDVTGDLLTLSGKKEKEEKVERKDYHRLERSSGAFTRTVRLPAEVVVEKVIATFRDGVLEVRAPRADPAKATARKIEVG